MKVTRKDNWRVVLEVEKPYAITLAEINGEDQAQINKRWQAAADEVAAQARRHLDGVGHVMVKWDHHVECSFCGYDWETEAASGRPECCDAAQAEWKADR